MVLCELTEFLSDHLADQRMEFGRTSGDLEGFAEHRFGFVEQGGIFGEESGEGLAGFEFVA